jgi:hypothetical protein
MSLETQTLYYDNQLKYTFEQTIMKIVLRRKYD